nr:unnamed protein product [Digitaria exilis]
MGKKPSGGGAGWLATVRMVFKSSKNERHGKKQRGGEAEGAAVGSGEAADIVSVDHFPTAETSPEVTNEGSSGAVVWREKGEHEVAGAARRDRQGIAAAVTAASRVARSGAGRGKAGSREERAAAVRIQAFYRGYLVMF